MNEIDTTVDLKRTALKTLEAVADRFTHLFQQGQQGFEFSPFSLLSLGYEVIAQIQHCEAHGLSRAEILVGVEQVRTLLRTSPFLSRLQEWPRGYPGDFETIEYLLGKHASLREGSPEQVVEASALSMPMCQQHRNKIQIQERYILQTVLKFARYPESHKPKILSIACGSCSDVANILDFLEDRDFQLTLNDADINALERAKDNLGPILESCTFLPGNIFRQINVLVKEGPFDLITIGGLMDYLSDKQASFLVAQLLTKTLAVGGKMIYTNIAVGNPYRLWMEYYGNWMLIERSEADMARFALETGVPGLEVRTYRENTSLSIICDVVNGSGSS